MHKWTGVGIAALVLFFSAIQVTSASTATTSAQTLTTASSTVATLQSLVATLETELKALVAAKSSTTASTPNQASVIFTRVLSFGSTGADVSALQQILKSAGFYTYPTITGYFGSYTWRAVAAFQWANGLDSVGYVGQKTRALLNGTGSASGGGGVVQPAAPPPSASSPSSPATTGITQLFPVAAGYGGGGASSGGGSSSPAPDTTPPSVSLTAPSSGSTVSGSSVTLTATASDNVAVANVQFKVDGANIGSAITSSPYTTTWNSKGVADGSHTIAAVAVDTSGNYATSSISVTVNNTPPVISVISSGTLTTTSATITWTTNVAATSQINYGTTTSYGTASSSAALVTLHSITLTGLTASTTYDFEVSSADSLGNLATSSNQTFTTVIILSTDADTYYNSGPYWTSFDAWGKGGLVNGVDYTQSMQVTPSLFPNNTLMSWNWGSGCSGGGVCAYPHIQFGNNPPTSNGPLPIQISALNNDSISFNYTLSGAGAFDVLDDEWLRATPGGSGDFEVELFAKLTNNASGRTIALPLSHHMTSPFSADVYAASGDSPPAIQIIPTSTFTDQFAHPTLSGAVAGTPGTDPTGTDFTNTVAGVTKTIVGSGTTTANDGTTINYVDVKLAGTPTASGDNELAFSSPWYKASVSTTYPQNWWFQPYIAVVGGATTNTTISLDNSGFVSTFGTDNYGGGADIKSNLTSTPRRFGLAFSAAHDDIGVWAAIFVTVTNGTQIGGSSNGITLRIGIAQNGGQPGLLGHDPSITVTNATWDLKAVYADLISAGLFTNAQYVAGHQFGVETTSGAGSMNLNSFNATQN